jgi:hypothetical protein
MLPVLNLSGHRICLSGPARAQNPLFSVGARSSAIKHCGGDGVLSLRCLRSSMTLWRSSQSQLYSCAARFLVMRHRASYSDRRRFGLADDTASLQARLARSLSPTEGSLSGTLADLSATTRFAALADLSGVIRWMVSESASRPPCGLWRIDDQQLDI